MRPTALAIVLLMALAGCFAPRASSLVVVDTAPAAVRTDPAATVEEVVAAINDVSAGLLVPVDGAPTRLAFRNRRHHHLLVTLHEGRATLGLTTAGSSTFIRMSPDRQLVDEFNRVISRSRPALRSLHAQPVTPSAPTTSAVVEPDSPEPPRLESTTEQPDEHPADPEP